MNHLVIGLGEVGKALRNILQCDGIDREMANSGTYDVLHICFPYSKSFVENVKYYIDFYQAKLVIVHSTVPILTCDPEGWVHSPIRGVHPNLEQGIRTFTKFFGGDRANEAARIFIDKGISVSTNEKAANTEALKLWDTTQYGIMILLEKEIHDFCEKRGLDFFLIYREGNFTYNDGYRELDMHNVVRPWLDHKPGPIGGHCVIPNAKLLDSPSAKRLLEENSRLED